MYSCKKIDGPIQIDGDLDKQVWKQAERSGRFVDVIGGTPGIYDTRCALLWDDDYLYVGFWCEEPYPSATLTKRDSLLWFENDLEVFIDGKDSYYEFQINALNTVYEVFYIWQDAFEKFNFPEFDVFKNNGLTFGGNHDRSGHHFWKGSHPRGNRWAFRNWDMPGLKTAVKIDGHLNDPSQISKGWTCELAFPWAGMKRLCGGRAIPPEDGDIWKLFLGRYQKFEMNGTNIHAGWALDKVGSDDNHYPEKFTSVVFKI